jgi:chorismate lyase
MGLQQGFNVERVFQGTGYVTGLDADMLGLPVGRKVKARRVRLHIGRNESQSSENQVVVLAQTLMAVNGPVCDWPFWRGLGSRSLGSVLFSDPGVERGTLYFAKLPASTPWVRGLLENLRHDRNKSDPKAFVDNAQDGYAMDSLHTTQPEFYARCAQYRRGQGTTPLWVFEVFLPALQDFKSGTLE